jgi:serine/threonine-protein kinase HipA
MLPDRDHKACLRKLFGTVIDPVLDLKIADLDAEARKLAGAVSVSGAQPKLVMKRSGNRLVTAIKGGRFIVKPQVQAFPHLPENEHLFMSLASALGIETPPCGLFKLNDGSWAYVVQRFDRTARKKKKRCEDFAQILGKDKYSGTVEQIGRRLKQLSGFPGLDAQFLFERVLYFFLIGNGDAHLKNFSMAETGDGSFRLSPAYDILCSKLVIPDEEDFAIPMNGKRDGIALRDFRTFARYLDIPEKAFETTLDRFAKCRDLMQDWIERSHLPVEERKASGRIVHARYDRLFAG